MNGRDLERLLAARGIGPTKMDVITRRLRHKGELKAGARGANAADVTGRSAAKILIATAGSGKGVAADSRLAVLAKLTSTLDGRTSLLSRLTRLIEGSPELERISECRIGRNVRAASLVFLDRPVEQFLMGQPIDYSSRLRVEGVIPGDLLREIAKLLANKASVPVPPAEEEPDFDA